MKTETRHDRELAGIDALDLPVTPAPPAGLRLWSAAWPRLAAAGVLLGAWQLVVLTGWKPEYVLPGPTQVFRRMLTDLTDGTLVKATGVTLSRAGIGFGIALILGVLLGVAVSRSRHLRAAIGSLISGLQTMPSIAWFPLAILLFQLSEKAILFVVVLGAAPAIANGLISGIDQIPRILLRAGKVLGAKGLATYRHVVIPGALPNFVGGLKQGWAFAWRSLMAGELLVIIAARPSLGAKLQLSREVSDSEGLLAAMLVILTIGIVADTLIFGRLERFIAARWGLAEPTH